MENTDILMRSHLFSGIDKKVISDILAKNPPKIKEFKRGDLVFSSANEIPFVGFILSGRCEIQLNRSDGSRTVLNILSESDSFGILSVYSADEFPTQIYATKNSEILFFTSEQMTSIVNNYSQISSNVIKFLANRICFLNKKIATFSGTTATDRLASFLLCERDRYGSDEFQFNCQKTAEEINCGRASVYRALSSLENAGLILIVDKKIYIKDLIGLERITK